MKQSISQVNTLPEQLEGGLWVTPEVYEVIHDVPRGSLSNWRFQEQHPERYAKRRGPRPVWRAFGRAIRYWLPPGTYNLGEVNAIRERIHAQRARKRKSASTGAPAGNQAA